MKEKGWLFTGDEFSTENPNSARRNENNERIIKVLKKMLDLTPALLFSSSGRIYRNGSAVLQRAIAYYDKMKEAIYEMRKSGFNSDEIVITLFGNETPLNRYTSGEFSRQNFVEGFSFR